MSSKEKAIVNHLNERARFFGGESAPQLDIYDVRAVLRIYQHTCLKCGYKPATSLDHVKPLRLGGSNTLDNLQLLCDNCIKNKEDNEDYRNGVFVNLSDKRKTKRTNNGNHGAKGRSGRKPSAFTILKRRVQQEKIEDAEYAFSLYATVMRDESEEKQMRLAAADWIAKRVLGQPTQPMAQDDRLKDLLEKFFNDTSSAG
jgi:hypothetical protein